MAIVNKFFMGEAFRECSSEAKVFSTAVFAWRTAIKFAEEKNEFSYYGNRIGSVEWQLDHPDFDYEARVAKSEDQMVYALFKLNRAYKKKCGRHFMGLVTPENRPDLIAEIEAMIM